MDDVLVLKIKFLVVLLISMTLFISQRLPVIITAIITITLLAATGVTPIDQALSGLSNEATVTIAAMFILSAGLIRTGALEPLIALLARWSRGSAPKLILAMGCTVPIASAFINNTPVVVMMVPVLMSLGRRFDIAPSKLMMPLSFFAIIGGTCTLVGTSTNLLIDGIYRDKTGVHIDIFEFTPLGIIFLIVGGTFILTIGKKLLPHRESLSALLPVSKRSHYVTEVIIQENSTLEGKLVKDCFPKESSLRFLQLQRDDDFYLAFNARELQIQEGDALILEGSPQDLTDLLTSNKVELGTVLEDSVRVPMRTFSLTMFELVVLPDSPYVGSRVRELQLNKHYGVKVLAIQRGGQHHRMDIRGMRIKAGDMMLVQGDLKGISSLKDASELLVIEEVDKHIRKPHKARIAFGLLLGVLLLTTLTQGRVPLVVAAMAGVVGMVLTHCLKTEEVISSLDFNVLFLLVGTIPLGYGLDHTGLASDLASFLYNTIGNNPFLMISALYLATNILTSLISNTAVAVLMTPLALDLAAQMGVDPKPLIMAVAFAASAAFATPIAYQTNVIVMGPGGYTFSDYVRVGLPLSLVLWVTASICIPLIWPFG